MIHLDGHSLTLNALVEIADRSARVAISADAAARVRAARAVVDRKAHGEEPVYGVNTGFGSFAEVKIAPDALEVLQRNLVRSHAAGVGDPLPVRDVRAAMALRANVLAKGYSGIRLETLDALVGLLNARVHPVVPSRGSVGASGDLAPLAHIALVLIGEGEAQLGEGSGLGARAESDREPDDDASPEAPASGRRVYSGAEALLRAGLAPVTLGPKEGLALINGTQPSTAVLALALAGAELVARAADIAAALSIDALRGSMHPFEERIHEARGFAGQIASAANIERLMQQSAINASHQNCGRVQDAYSMRCAAQVHGATRDALAFVRRTVETEANAATDNPMVFVETDEIVSGGNFHGAPIALAADLLAAALVPLATISERRTDRLVDPTEERPAGLPDARRRAAIGADDCPGHRGGVRLGAEIARAPGRRRHDPDVGRPGRPRQHEHERRAQGRGCARARSRRDRHRNPVRVPGARPARAAHHVGSTRARAPACPIDGAGARRRPSAVARDRRDRAHDRVARAGRRCCRTSQVKNFSFSV